MVFLERLRKLVFTPAFHSMKRGWYDLGYGGVVGVIFGSTIGRVYRAGAREEKNWRIREG